MKKFTLTAVLALAALTASATDIGLRVGRNDSTETNNAGVTVSQQFGKFGAEAAFDRTVSGNANDRFSAVGTYNVATFGAATVTAKAGGAYVKPTVGDSGYAALAGVGVSYPLVKNVSVTADYAYQKGQDRISALNGNTYAVGVKYSF